jgi:hypothetical protein
MNGIESSLRRNAAWALVSLAYLFAFPYFERLNNPNENVRVWATRAIVQHHTLEIDPVEREWGWVNDKSKNEHHVYSAKAPGASFLGVPVLFAQTKLRQALGWPAPSKRETTFWLRLLAVKLPLCVFLWFFARYVHRITGSPAARDLLVVALGLGTLLYPYGNVFVGHALAPAAAFAGYMLLAPEDDGVPRPPSTVAVSRLLGAGLLVGMAVTFEYQAALVAAVLSVYALARYRVRALAFFAGALPPAAALGAYHTALFGRPWRMPYGNIENPAFLWGHTVGYNGLSSPKLWTFGWFLFSADYGLFIFSPVLLLGVLSAIVLVVRGPRREGLLVLAVSLLMFVFLSGMANWRAGWCVGPRYIATVAPFMVMALARVWPRLRARPWLSGLVAGLIIPAVLLNVVSGAVYPHYPEQFDNPLFDLAFPLLGQGYAPYSVGWLLGLRGLVSLAPLALVVLAAVAIGAGGDDPRPRRWVAHTALAVVVAALFLLPLSAYGRKPRPGEAQAAAFVRSTWEPLPAPARPAGPSKAR